MSYFNLNISNPSFEAFPFLDTAAVGDESKIIMEEMEKSANHYSYPVSQTWSNPYLRFKVLKREWESETKYLSSTTEISMHPAYQKIIGMGPVALPFILSEMKQKSGHWFWALKSITGEDPALPLQRGRMRQMTEAWIKWGKGQGFI